MANFQRVLQSLYYVDNNVNCTAGVRDIEIEAFYGNTGSNTAVCKLTVSRGASRNDHYYHEASRNGAGAANYRGCHQSHFADDQANESVPPAGPLPTPYVDLSGGNGGPTFTTGYTYGGSNYTAHICPNAVVTYSGLLTSATITLINRPDGRGGVPGRQWI